MELFLLYAFMTWTGTTIRSRCASIMENEAVSLNNSLRISDFMNVDLCGVAVAVGGLGPFKQNDYSVQPALILRAAFYHRVCEYECA
jgi:hypothetical protein